MNRKKILIGLLLVVMLVVTGCKNQEQKKGYTVYYVNQEHTKLTEASYEPSAETFDEMMKELFGQLMQAPNGSVSAVPDDVSVKGYERSIDALRIDFSKEYYEMDHITEVLLRAAVIKTISQIPGVSKIMITVDGEQLVDQDGDLVPAMDAASFIDTKEGGINSYQYANLTFYFSDQTGEKLSEEAREVHYSSNMILARVVIEQIIKGPEQTDLKAVVPADTKIVSLNVNEGICTVNFDAEFNKEPSETAVKPETAIYAIVNSVCGTCEDITGMRFEINGENDLLFRDMVDLTQTFEPQMQLIETEPSSEAAFQEETEVTSMDSEESGNPAVGVDPLMDSEE